MTMIFPEPTCGDKVLAMMGKRRALFIPDIYGAFGKYAYGRAIKESFLHALFRMKRRALPEGWFYLEEILSGTERKGKICL